jgi:hypothetical protein
MTAAVSFTETGAEAALGTLPPSRPGWPRPAGGVRARAAGDRPQRIGDVLPEVLARYGLELAHKKSPPRTASLVM